MSNDAQVTKDLIETLEDGREGFAKGAEKLRGDDQPQLADTFIKYSEQRAKFSAELRAMAATYGDKIDEDGSFVATLHRGWLSLKDALTGSNPKGVLDAAEQGEDHAVKEFKKALDADISAGLREVVARQLTDVKAAHDDVRALRDSYK